MSAPKQLDDDCGRCLLFGAIQALSDGLVLLDDDGLVLLLNPRASALLDIGPGAIGTPLARIAGHPGLAAFLLAASEEEGPVTAEVGIRGGLTLRVTSSPCTLATGERLGRLLILRDVSREKKIQVEISAAVAEKITRLAGPTTGGDPLPELTRREREILALVAAGMTNATIADRLHVSSNTVASHLKNLYSKLGVRTRSQAVALAVAHGVVAAGD